MPNYAIPSNSLMIAHRPIKRRKTRSEMSKKIAQYCDTHDVTVYVDPDTDEIFTKIIAIKKNGK